MFNIQSLKKMTTERIARKFEQLFNWLPFNVYEDRELMIGMLIGLESPEISITIETYESAPINEAGHGYVFKASKLIESIGSAIRNAGKYEPMRTEYKGRKSRFSFREIMDMLQADVQGMRLSDIAKYYSTSYAVIIQILEGKTYQWASGINQGSY